jgi:hypothetical protein
MHDDSHGRAFDILTEALQAMGAEGISKQEAIPALVDFTVSVALIVGREAADEAGIIRIRDQIADWRAGNFPARSTETASFPVPSTRPVLLATPDQLTTELSSELAEALDMLFSRATDKRTLTSALICRRVSFTPIWRSTVRGRPLPRREPPAFYTRVSNEQCPVSTDRRQLATLDHLAAIQTPMTMGQPAPTQQLTGAEPYPIFNGYARVSTDAQSVAAQG